MLIFAPGGNRTHDFRKQRQTAQELRHKGCQTKI